MCCDLCTKYDECEATNCIKENCCLECTEYNYCHGGKEDKYKDEELDDDM